MKGYARFGSVALTSFAVALALGACGGGGSGEVREGSVQESVETASASATLSPTQGSTVQGTVTFTQTPEGVRVFAQLSGLTTGEHGFHVHENGDCSAPDGSSAGGHFNPTDMPHDGPDAEQRHVGDLGNIVADEAGNAILERVDAHLSLTDPATSIVGRAVIVHGNADDMTSQPSGAAGPRMACGVITMSQ